MNSFYLRGDVLTPGGLRSDHVMEVSGKRLGKIYPAADFKPPVAPIALNGTLLPGFIDLQVNPVASWDLVAGGERALQGLAKGLAKQGCTGFLAALITGEEKKLLQTLKTLGTCMGRPTGGARFLGFHSEGPFLNPERAGVHPIRFMRRPSAMAFQKILKAAGSSLKMMTLAPELPGGAELTRLLAKEKIVPSIGHSNADYAQAMKAFDAGVRSVTHLFNASSPMHHRAPGIPGAALERADVFAQIIPDGLHVHSAALRLAYRAKGPKRLAMVTDALAGDKSSFSFAGQQVKRKDGCFVAAGGTMAGSDLSMASAWAHASRFVPSAAQTDLIQCLTLTPASLLGLERETGSLEEGKFADMVLLDAKQEVAATWVQGEQVYVRDHRVYRRV